VKLDKTYHIYGLFRTGMRIRNLALVAFLACSQLVVAQGDTGPDFIRSSGKIYVVAGVCLIILLTLFVYLVRLDRKITKLEKRQNNE